MEYRAQEWDVDFLKYLKKLEEEKPVIFCGDLNVAHKEIDLKNPKTNKRNAGFTDEERSGFDNYIASGFIDTFREFEKGEGHYIGGVICLTPGQKMLAGELIIFVFHKFYVQN